MRKWISALGVILAVTAVGLVIRQIREDLSDDAALWESVTDDPEQD